MRAVPPAASRQRISGRRNGRSASGLDVAAFRGLRFVPERVRDLAAVTAPPYDMVGPAELAALEHREEHNVVRLILPRPDAHDDEGGRYRRAAGTLRRWRAEGILALDPHPALYVYEQRTAGTVQRGLIGAVALRDPGSGVIVPHEEVMPGPVADRLELMTATDAQLEPILLLHDGDPAAGAELAAVLDETAGSPPTAAFTEPVGGGHSLWALDGVAAEAASRALSHRWALIADGHHRYAAYRAAARRHQAAGRTGGPWERGLALLVDPARHPLQLTAIHRSIAGLDWDTAVRRAAAGPLAAERVDADSWRDRLAAAGRAGPALAVVDPAHGHAAMLTVHDEPGLRAGLGSAIPSGLGAGLGGLDTTVLHELLLPRLWGVEETRVGYHHDAADALRVAAATGGCAVLLNPTRVEDVMAVAGAGAMLPRKSTSFGPKPRTGLVMRVLDGEPRS